MAYNRMLCGFSPASPLCVIASMHAITMMQALGPLGSCEEEEEEELQARKILKNSLS